jgi:hypothetical protein
MSETVKLVQKTAIVCLTVLGMLAAIGAVLGLAYAMIAIAPSGPPAPFLSQPTAPQAVEAVH